MKKKNNSYDEKGHTKDSLSIFYLQHVKLDNNNTR